MFYDRYLELCNQRGISPTRAAIEIGISKATPTTWKKRGLTPQGDTLNKVAAYFGVSTDHLLGNEEKAPTREGERTIGFDDFTYAMQNETQALTDGDKELLLSMARQLNEARKRKNGENN